MSELKMHEKVERYLGNVIEDAPADFVDKDFGDIEFRHELLIHALGILYSYEKIEGVTEQMQEAIIDSLDTVMEHQGIWSDLEEIVVTYLNEKQEAQQEKLITIHHDYRRDVL